MARMLRENESTDFYINAVWRHIRLCRKTSGAEKFALNIEPVYQELIAKQNASKGELLKRQSAYDDIMLYDTAPGVWTKNPFL